MKYTLVGVDGNAFAILGYVRRVMKEEGYSDDEIESYTESAKQIDYNHLVSVSLEKIHEINSKKRES